MRYARFPAKGLKKGVIDIEKIGGFGKREPVKRIAYHAFFKKGRNIVLQLFFTEMLFPVQKPCTIDHGHCFWIACEKVRQLFASRIFAG